MVEPFNFEHHMANSPFLLPHITYSRDGGEFLDLPKESMLGDHILCSHDFADSEGIDIAKRNLMLVTIGG